MDSDGTLTEHESAALLPTLLDVQSPPPDASSYSRQSELQQQHRQKIPIDVLLNEPTMGMDPTVFTRRFSERLPGVTDVGSIFTALDLDANSVVTPSELRQVQWNLNTTNCRFSSGSKLAYSAQICG